MSAMKPHLYINSRGFFVTRHSYSGSESFAFCARKYYLERVQGWSEKQERSSKFFGTALEKAVQFWHQNGQNTTEAVSEFIRLWAEHKDQPYLYSKVDASWDALNMSGQELVQLHALRYPTFPYTVPNPKDAFQVQTNFEVFPGSKLEGIEFTSYIDCVGQIKATEEPLIIDMKTSGVEIPDLTVLDPQLRSYSWVKGWPNVAFLWFRKMGRSISRGDSVTLLVPYADMLPGTELFVMAKDDMGLWVSPNEKDYEEMGEKFVGESKAVKAERQVFVEAHSKFVPERTITKQRLQFKMAFITPESAEDIGRSIKRDVVNIANANEKEFWPMQSGVRYPNQKCPNCAMRGICSNNSDLRDALVVRKQMEEIDFGKESE